MPARAKKLKKTMTQKKRAVKRTRKPRAISTKRAQWEKKFFADLRLNGIIGQAARVAGVSPGTVYQYNHHKPEFHARVVEAQEEAYDSMEREVGRRAFEGTMEPVYQGGLLVGHRRKFSDNLAMFMLRGNRPDKFRENVALSGNVEHNHKVDLRGLIQAANNGGFHSPEKVIDVPADATKFITNKKKGKK